MVDHEFWLALDKLVFESEIVIDRPAGSKHPRHIIFMNLTMAI